MSRRQQQQLPQKQQQASSSLCEQAVLRVPRSKQRQQLLQLCVFV
jgi:hypothetical protein